MDRPEEVERLFTTGGVSLTFGTAVDDDGPQLTAGPLPITGSMAKPKDIALAALARTGKCPSGANTQV